MLRIRLQRTGNRNNPTYRLVVTDKRNAAKKAPLEIIGFYLPTRDPAEFSFEKDRVEFHLKNGAAPTDTVARLLSKEGISGLEKYMERYKKQKKKKAVEEEPEAPKEEQKEETPKEEVKEEKPAEEPKEEEKEEEKKEEVKEEEKPAEEPKEEEKKED